MFILNSRDDLESLRGTPEFVPALLMLHGSMTTWSLVDGSWQAEEDLSTIERLGYNKHEFLAEVADLGFPAPPAPNLPTPVTEAEVRAEGARRLALVARPYAPEERETWHVQVREANAFTADSAAPTPMLAAIAAARSQTVAEFAARVLAKNDAFAAATGAVLAAQAAILALDPLPADYADDSRWSLP